MLWNFSKKIDAAELIKRLKEIFEDHKDLLSKLNNFLPIECEIELPLDGEQSSPKKHVKKEDAINFLKKIKVFSVLKFDGFS
ncbi:hypothetical protein P8452_42512 [Trifolium repens]|nr:hypothetical protein P8452_42512 [Trifolium repens]